MTKHHPQNERMKHAYLTRLREARGMSEASIDHVAKAIARFEQYTGGRDFKAFHREQAKGFKQSLASQASQKNGKPLSKATVYSTMTSLKAFFMWLAEQPGYKSRIHYDDAEYFNVSMKDARVAKSAREKRVPTIEQIRYVVGRMPAGTDIERRDRAIIAATVLTGARDGALASIKIKHIDLQQGVLYQDAREVRTKASKSFPTYFFPVGDDFRDIFVGWIEFLRTERHFGFDDPVFPASRVELDETGKFHAVGVDRRAWSNADRIRAVFKTAFEAAGLPYFNPHSVRNLLARLGQQMCPDIESMKAWSQNLGHEDLTTTFTAYGALSSHRQAQLIQAIRTPETR